MKLRTPLIASAILIGLILAASLWAWGRLGDAPVATHFGVDGRPNGYMAKLPALMMTPAIAVGLTVLFAVLPAIMPSNSRLERSWGPYVVVWLSILALLTATHIAMLSYALGQPIDMRRVVVIGVGGLFAIVGNLLGKVRYNYVFGVRTPWTLSNERVWDRTHRFAGRMLALGGLTTLGAGLLTPPAFADQLHLVVLVCILFPAAASVGYSFLESRRFERGDVG
jgi:uncharacterized membrane protein